MKNKNKIFRGFLLLVMVSCFWLWSDAVHAEDNQDQEATGFTVQSVIPDNQVDANRTFFYLQVEPAKPQVIQVKVRSTRVEPVTVKVEIHDAVSSSVGAIDYAKYDPKLDESLNDPITSFVTINDDQTEVTVQNYEEKVIEYTIQPPATPFSGVKLGSLRFVNKDENAERDPQTGLSTEYAYVIALMLREDDERFNMGADLHLKEVDLKLSNGRKVIAANIQNNQPKVLQEMEIQGNVKRKGESEILAHNRMGHFAVAPNSNFDFEMPLDLNAFSAGTYVFTGKAEGDGKVWRWEEEFTIDSNKAAKINEETAFKLVIPWWVPWVAGGLSLAFVLLIIYLVKRQRQWQNKGA